MIPTTTFFSIEGFFIVALAPFIAKLWTSLNRQGYEPSTPAKFAIGLSFTALSFFILSMAAKNAAISGYCSALWIVAAYLFMAIGELSLSPIGLSAITRLAPKTLISLFIGTWFLASSVAGYLAGLIAKIASLPAHEHTAQINLTAAASNYAYTFDVISWTVLAISLLAFIVTPLIKRMIQ